MPDEDENIDSDIGTDADISPIEEKPIHEAPVLTVVGSSSEPAKAAYEETDDAEEDSDNGWGETEASHNNDETSANDSSTDWETKDQWDTQEPTSEDFVADPDTDADEEEQEEQEVEKAAFAETQEVSWPQPEDSVENSEGVNEDTENDEEEDSKNLGQSSGSLFDS